MHGRASADSAPTAKLAPPCSPPSHVSRGACRRPPPRPSALRKCAAPSTSGPDGHRPATDVDARPGGHHCRVLPGRDDPRAATGARPAGWSGAAASRDGQARVLVSHRRRDRRHGDAAQPLSAFVDRADAHRAQRRGQQARCDAPPALGHHRLARDCVDDQRRDHGAGRQGLSCQRQHAGRGHPGSLPPARSRAIAPKWGPLPTRPWCGAPLGPSSAWSAPPISTCSGRS